MRSITSFLAFFILFELLYAQLTVNDPTTSSIDFTDIDFAWKSYDNVIRSSSRSISELRSLADTIYSWNRGFSITFGPKNQIPPSNSTNDYISYATYWWPSNTPACNADPNSKDCVFIRIDGKRVAKTYAKDSIYSMTSCVLALSTAAVRFNSKRYATRAQEMIRMFLMNGTTRMNPNVNYGQYLRGKYSTGLGRKEGLIDVRSLSRVVNSYKLLKKAGLWRESSREFQNWFKDFAKWLTTSPIALGANDTANNQAMWYQSTLAMVYYASNQTEQLQSLLKSFPQRTQLWSQFREDGELTTEASRENPYHYRRFLLQAAYNILSLGRTQGIEPADLKGDAILKATRYVLKVSVQNLTSIDLSSVDNPYYHRTLANAANDVFGKDTINTTEYFGLFNNPMNATESWFALERVGFEYR
ncbi:alginate lyase-domain-containing protein [Cladochytrium replicatum]|nr:alginate lyase-domain-containing protein [Cladochytrium replicatum]